MVLAEEQLPVYGSVPAFSLTDQDGHVFSSESLQGKVWIADFVFTRCAGQCPMMTAQMGRLAQAFAGQPKLALVSFSVDPEHDTPEALERYAKAQGIADARWRLLTGPRQAIWELCQRGFRLALAEDPESPDEPITHSTRLVVVDAEGSVRGFYDATDTQQIQQLRRVVALLLAGHLR